MTNMKNLTHTELINNKFSIKPWKPGSRGPDAACSGLDSSTSPCSAVYVPTGCTVGSAQGCGETPDIPDSMCGLPDATIIKNVYSPNDIGTLIAKIPSLSNKNPALSVLVEDLIACKLNDYGTCNTFPST